jgi:hypothetical protein
MIPVWLAAAAIALTCIMVDESAARVVGVGYRDVGVYRGVAFSMARRRAWNKGLEVGKKDAFTPDQVKRIRALLAKRGVR